MRRLTTQNDLMYHWKRSLASCDYFFRHRPVQPAISIMNTCYNNTSAATFDFSFGGRSARAERAVYLYSLFVLSIQVEVVAHRGEVQGANPKLELL